MAKNRRVYMDFAAATPLSRAAERAYVQALKVYGNASAPHAEGREARAAVTAARASIARTLAVKPEELVFTSGGTEANTIALLGHIRARHREGADFTDLHVVTTTLEHSSILKTCTFLEELGVKVTYVGPRADGLVTPESMVAAVTERTTLVSVHHVQSETGTVQQVSDIARAVKKKNPHVIVHVDASQSPLWQDAGPHRLRADLVTYDAQKVQGPKGVGILYRDFSVPLAPVMGGGTQERSLRPGTENVPAIVAAAVAFEEAAKGRRERVAKVTKLRDVLLAQIEKKLPDVVVIGTVKRRVANNLFVGFRGVDGDYLAVLMDKEGVAVTPRSACLGSGGALSESALALTGDESLARGTIRFSLGPTISISEINKTVKVLEHVHMLFVEK